MVKAAAASTNRAVMCVAEKELDARSWKVRNAAAECQGAASWGQGRKEENLNWEASTGKSTQEARTLSNPHNPRRLELSLQP